MVLDLFGSSRLRLSSIFTSFEEGSKKEWIKKYRDLYCEISFNVMQDQFCANLL